ncbi:hypothetical protein [Streptomyces sp. MP131-18]|uniref:hypothetical protein n=1 Tax=Streptomyces sp. MP131-18 TaxID=1857892 RepID=UPI00097BDA54|nr:hypothetical protein [Streptomyces sp. MP131-18]ONK15277.1 hypothetical protein STBA_60920 [Streptomyces sp. MP131-18]
MQAPELAAAAVRVLTGGAPASAEQESAVRELVWGRLGRSTLGASALARLHEQRDEGSASIVASVLAEELRADPDFAGLMSKVLRLWPAPPARTATPQGAAAGPPPAFPPPMPAAAAPAQVTPDAAEVWKVWLLGLPQLVLVYIVINIAAPSGAGGALSVVMVLASAGLAAYGVWRGSRLLRRGIRGRLLEAGLVLNVLVLIVPIRLVLGLLLGG